jgi:hypothetical protein
LVVRILSVSALSVALDKDVLVEEEEEAGFGTGGFLAVDVVDVGGFDVVLVLVVVDLVVEGVITSDIGMLLRAEVTLAGAFVGVFGTDLLVLSTTGNDPRFEALVGTGGSKYH